MKGTWREMRDVALAVLRHLAALAAGVVSVPLVARHLGPEGLGAWTLLATAAFMLGASDLGLGVVLQRAWTSGRDDEARRVMGGALLVVALAAPLLAGVGMALEPPPTGPLSSRDLGQATVLALGGGVVAAYGFPLRSFLVAAGAMRELAKVRVCTSVVQVSAMALGLAWAPTLTTAAAALGLSSAVETAMMLRATRNRDQAMPRRPRPVRPAVLAGWMKEGGAALSINLGGLIASRADVVVLAAVAASAGDTEALAIVGAYGVAARAVDQAFGLAKQTSTALLGRLGGRHGRDAREATLRRGTALVSAIVSSGMVALAAFGQPLLVLWAGPVAARPEATIALWLLAAGAVVSSFHEVAAAGLMMSARSPWTSAVPLVVGYGANLLVTIFGATPFGAVAIAGGGVVGSLLTCTMVWWAWRRLEPSMDVLRCLTPGLSGLVASVATATAISKLHGALSLATSLVAIVVTGVAGLAGAGVVWLRLQGFGTMAQGHQQASEA